MKTQQKNSAVIRLPTLFAGALIFLVACRPEQVRVPSRTDSGTHELAGFITANGEPIGGALVRLKGTTTSTMSNKDGSFSLPRMNADLHEADKHQTRVTAWKDGHFIGGASVTNETELVSIDLSPLPQHDNVDYHWVDPVPDESKPERCGNCHDEIYKEWKQSSHSQSMRSKHFDGLVNGTDWLGKPGVGWSLNDEHPHGVSVCDACHAPTREASFADTSHVPGAMAGDNPSDVGNVLEESVLDTSVHCDFCHKIADVETKTLGTTHGRFAFALRRPTHGQLFFGPLDDVDRGEDAFSPLQSKSLLCAPCHEGVVFGVPVYTTYSEWLASPAAKAGRQCQDCHMAPTGTMRNIAPGHGGIERSPFSLASHSFLPNGQEAMLRSCLTLKVTADLQTRPATSRDDVVSVTVQIEATNVGHRIPTGFIDRHLILVVEAFNKEQQPVALLEGPTLPSAAGSLQELPGYLFAKLLVAPNEADLQTANPQPFWRAGVVIQDTRLKPEQAEQFVFHFPRETKTISTKLIYRPFWESVANDKGWPAQDTLVCHQTTLVASASESSP